ncbi:Putative serine protease HhoA precursor [Stieleria maiorica]|uniref:Serine protease HhoA n=1 Tax=Stieleria maiorica TaxID=2795974 RepID=A0A5B9MMA4_9BACT|nr:trypsin-like peptidase domain-containing protein [Stieleria maiorica]QEG01161.1 Putative serine protease HhoA precursor [Stieleria maiorica]
MNQGQQTNFMARAVFPSGCRRCAHALVYQLSCLVVAIAITPVLALADDAQTGERDSATIRENAFVQNAFVEGAGADDPKRRAESDAAGTRVSLPIDLEPIHRRGGVPQSLEILRLMEKQQRRVAERASKCTVSVKIGPAQGCGVIVSDTGFIITAAHVAMRPKLKAIVTLSDGRQVAATTLGMNREVDAGLIRIDPGQNGGKPWPHASLGTSDSLVPGMWCIAMGHPGGYDPSRGAVIRVGRMLEVRPEVIRTDCALIGGDSGGPLFNFAGELIAVHSRIGNDVADNLHVPIDHYDYSWDRMALGEAWGFLPNFKPTLGVSGNRSTKVAEIIAVKPGMAAEAGGMLAGDVVIKFGTKPITDFQSLVDAVADTMPGERVSVLVERGNTTVRLVIEIGRSG